MNQPNNNATHKNAVNLNVKNVNDTATNHVEFDFAMCHGSYYCCRYYT